MPTRPAMPIVTSRKDIMPMNTANRVLMERLLMNPAPVAVDWRVSHALAGIAPRRPPPAGGRVHAAPTYSHGPLVILAPPVHYAMRSPSSGRHFCSGFWLIPCQGLPCLMVTPKSANASGGTSGMAHDVMVLPYQPRRAKPLSSTKACVGIGDGALEIGLETMIFL